MTSSRFERVIADGRPGSAPFGTSTCWRRPRTTASGDRAPFPTIAAPRRTLTSVFSVATAMEKTGSSTAINTPGVRRCFVPPVEVVHESGLLALLT